MCTPIGIAGAVLLVEVRTQKSIRRIDHDEACRDSQVVRAVHSQMARVQLIIETGQGPLVRRHAGLRFERQ